MNNDLLLLGLLNLFRLGELETVRVVEDRVDVLICPGVNIVWLVRESSL